MFFLFESLLILCLLFFSVFWGTKRVDNNLYDALSIDNTNCLRGVFALLILLHHLAGYYTSFSFIAPFKHIGYIVVAFFFFLSGYGLGWGYYHKRDYLNRFLTKHLLKLVVPYYFCLIFCIVVLLLAEQQFPNPQSLLLSLVFVGDVIPVGWYIGELIIFYIVFYISFRFQEKKRIAIFAFLFTIIVVLLLLSPLRDLWTRSVLGFPLGIIWCKKKNIIEARINKYYILSVCLASFALCIGIIFKVFGDHIDIFLVKFLGNSISSVFAIIVLNCILLKIQIGNLWIKFLGSISFEVYLYHVLILEILGNNNIMQEHCALFCIIALFATIIVAVFAKKLNSISSKTLCSIFHIK